MHCPTLIFFALVTFFTSPIHGYGFGAPSCVDQPKHGLDPQEREYIYASKYREMSNCYPSSVLSCKNAPKINPMKNTLERVEI